MSEVYDSLIAGLNEALAFAQGEETSAVVQVLLAMIARQPWLVGEWLRQPTTG